ncbi:uncharacterized protein LAESUDRAFT_814726 [Laetiporus sulphureus 93-53]|uniref:Uncharacterized protein n=1 Tax=Laetiporus sulphureus 93-53 TaxID=1314785 RepID=A0A165CUB0_9APHY|nr:uncharacterized protein LAESUDRAFT_814726 [Laetiporus sulphureus 93-53]KZT03446.1 hypothetical protein LAESUDRAFT_814726 [Laetiporus sulphureus 93-53]
MHISRALVLVGPLEDHETGFVKLHQCLWGKGGSMDAELFSERPVVSTVGSDFIHDMNNPPLRVLTLPELSIQPQAMLVREEYEEALRYFDLRYSSNPSGGVLITGHPGIGKSIFLRYILVMRILRGEPTLYQHQPDSMFLFHAKGVFRLPTDRLEAVSRAAHLEQFSDAFALVDVGDELEEPAKNLLSQWSPFFLVAAVLPRTGERPWMRIRKMKQFVMNAWSWPEIVIGNTLQRRELSESVLFDVFTKFGPVPRVCYQFAEGRFLDEDMEDWNKRVVALCKSIPSGWNSPTNVLALAAHPDFDKVFLLRPHDSDRRQEVYDVISRHIGRLILDMHIQLHGAQTSKLYDLLHDGGQSPNLAAAVLFEHFLCSSPTRCIEGRKIQVYRKIRYSFDENVVAGSATTIMQYVDKLPRRYDAFTSLSADSGEILWLPNSPAFDAFSVFFRSREGYRTPHKHLGGLSAVILIATFARRHRIPTRALEALASRFPEDRQPTTDCPWSIVFIVPEGQKLECWVDSELWADKLEVVLCRMVVTDDRLKKKL